MVSLGQNLTSTRGDFMWVHTSYTLLSNKPLKPLSPGPALLIPLSWALQRRLAAFTCIPFILWLPRLPSPLPSLPFQERLWKILLDLFVYILCVLVCVCMYVYKPQAWWYLERPDEGIRSPGSGGIDGHEPACGCWELNLGLCKSNKCSELMSLLSKPDSRHSESHVEISVLTLLFPPKF